MASSGGTAADIVEDDSGTSGNPGQNTVNDGTTSGTSTPTQGLRRASTTSLVPQSTSSSKNSRENSPVRPPLKSGVSANSSNPRSRKNSTDLSPHRTPGLSGPIVPAVPSAAAIQRALSVAGASQLQPTVHSDATGEPAKPQKQGKGTGVSQNQLGANLPRVRSPPPSVTQKKPSLHSPRKPDQPNVSPLTPSIVVDRPNRVPNPSAETSETGEEHLTHSGMRTPTRGPSSGCPVLETVQESSLPTTPALATSAAQPTSGKSKFDTRPERIDENPTEEAFEEASTSRAESGNESAGSKGAGKKNEIKDTKAQEAAKKSARPQVIHPKKSFTQLQPAKTKTGAEGSVKTMTVETETVSSIPTVALGGGTGERGLPGRSETSGSLRLKQSTETIRPKKEKKKVVRKAPSLNAGTGGLHKFKRSHHHHVLSRPPSPEFALARSHTSPATSLGASPVTENAHFSPRFRTRTDGLSRDASSEFQPFRRQHVRRFSSSGLTNARGRIASSKADIFEAKIATAVGEADSSDSEETFVYESNPPEPLSARPYRFHSRTPSATSMASQIDQYGGRTRADGHHSVAGKKSMKFSNSSYHSGAHAEPGDGTNRGLNQGGRGSSAHHHHLGRYGRNAGHTSLFDNESPFSSTVQPLRVQAGNVTKSSLRKSSPRNHHLLRIPGNSKNVSEVMDYDIEGEGADDERTPLMGTARSGRNRIHRRQNTGSFRNGYPIEEKGRRECRSVTAYASLATLVTALVAAVVIVLVMCSKSLELLHIKSIRSVLASEQELMFDLHVGAINPNLVAVQVSDLDVNIFAKSKHVVTGSVPRSSTFQRHSYARKVAKYAPIIGPEGRDYQLDLPLPAHTADGVDEGTDPMPDPETDSQTMLLGRIFEFDSPLVFDPSPIKRQLTSSIGSVRLARPGNSTEEGGSARWEKVLEHDFELIVRGVVRYSLPLSSRWRSASIGRSVVVHPSVQGDPETGTMALSEPSHLYEPGSNVLLGDPRDKFSVPVLPEP
ncbi:MAG: hypothetical protein LQ342_001452 [Letrouitia transgressa]|nr:MAG: hypothetical protein LQ342_001452 [Letrouitia transgressa]